MNHIFLILTFVLLAALMGLTPQQNSKAHPSWITSMGELEKPRFHYVRPMILENQEDQSNLSIERN